jgi:hypothetical protein
MNLRACIGMPFSFSRKNYDMRQIYLDHIENANYAEDSTDLNRLIDWDLQKIICLSAAGRRLS